MTNWTPRAANTLASPLRLTAISFNAGVLTLTWSAIPGRTYRVEFKASLDDKVWSAVGAEVVALNVTASAMDALGVNAQRFYRVRRID